MLLTIKSTLQALLVISCLVLSLPGNAQELPERYRFNDEITAFMNQLRIEASDLKQPESIPGSDPLENKKELEKMPFYQRLQGFVQQQAQEYLKIRRYEFEKLLPPPPSLQRLLNKAATGSNNEALLLEDPALFKLLCLNALTPGSMAFSISIHARPLLPEEATTMEPITRGFIGSLLYGRKLQQDKWQLWYISRGMGIAFYIDLATMRLSELSYIRLKELQPAIAALHPVLHPKDGIDSLWLDENDYRWRSERNALDHPDEKGALEVAEKMDHFYARNAARYAACRRLALSRFPLPVDDTSAYALVADSSLFSDTDQLLASMRAAIDVPYISNQLSIHTVLTIHPDEKPDYTALALESMSGFLHKAASAKDPDTWLIQATGKKKRIEYRWNIKTGKVTVLNYYEKKP
ncbi:hypothetical protein [Niabella beijingensis]|uniref:hypothetical protein n=1 Tax=Niabella beijingensis TaxID=2872700 RepID=UPI001CBCC82D|nr:hypothetical protein [Niabella beijingensis]MBZ4191435.1 hypothetical protein [Niabella beijingensis]